MATAVKLSEDIISEAKIMSKALNRSIAGQIEFWAIVLSWNDVLFIGRFEKLQHCKKLFLALMEKRNVVLHLKNFAPTILHSIKVTSWSWLPSRFTRLILQFLNMQELNEAFFQELSIKLQFSKEH